MELEVLSDIRSFLHAFQLVQQSVSAEKTPTLSIAIPLYEKLLVLLKLKRRKHKKIAHGVNASIRKVNKYLKKARRTRIYSLAMGKSASASDRVINAHSSLSVINPQFKFTWIDNHWSPEESKSAAEWIKEAVSTEVR